MTRYGRNRRSLAYYAEYPRAFDVAVEDWNERELARYERQVDRDEPDVDPDFRMWLLELEPDEDKT